MDSQCINTIFRFFDDEASNLTLEQKSAVLQLQRAFRFNGNDEMSIPLKQAIEAYLDECPRKGLRRTKCGRTILVSHVQSAMTDQALYEMFSDFGRIVGFRVFPYPTKKEIPLTPMNGVPPSFGPHTLVVRGDGLPLVDWKTEAREFLTRLIYGRDNVVGKVMNMVVSEDFGGVYLDFESREIAREAQDQLLRFNQEAYFVRPKSCVLEFDSHEAAREALCYFKQKKGQLLTVTMGRKFFVYDFEHHFPRFREFNLIPPLDIRAGTFTKGRGVPQRRAWADHNPTKTHLDTKPTAFMPTSDLRPSTAKPLNPKEKMWRQDPDICWDFFSPGGCKREHCRWKHPTDDNDEKSVVQQEATPCQPRKSKMNIDAAVFKSLLQEDHSSATGDSTSPGAISTPRVRKTAESTPDSAQEIESAEKAEGLLPFS